jgi:hypothetical protein
MPLPLAAVVWTGVRWAAKKGIKKAAKRVVKRTKKTPKPSSKATQKSLRSRTTPKNNMFTRDINVLDKAKPVGRRGTSLAKVSGSKGKQKRLMEHSFKEFKEAREYQKTIDKMTGGKRSPKMFGGRKRSHQNLMSLLGKKTYKYSQRKGK